MNAACQTLEEAAGYPTRIDAQGVERPITCQHHLRQIARSRAGLSPCPPGMSGLGAETATIPGWQKTIHVVTEAASILLVPWVLAAAKEARQPHKARLQFLAAGMLVVDGFLLINWFRRR